MPGRVSPQPLDLRHLIDRQGIQGHTMHGIGDGRSHMRCCAETDTFQDIGDRLPVTHMRDQIT